MNEKSILNQPESKGAVGGAHHGVGSIKNHARAGEQVENLDRALRNRASRFDCFHLLLPIVSSQNKNKTGTHNQACAERK